MKTGTGKNIGFPERCAMQKLIFSTKTQIIFYKKSSQRDLYVDNDFADIKG